MYPFMHHLCQIALQNLRTSVTTSLPSPSFRPLCADCRPPFSLITGLTIKDQAYPNTKDLLALDKGGPRSSYIPPITDITTINTPLSAPAWEEALQDHPDKHLCEYIIKGIIQVRVWCIPCPAVFISEYAISKAKSRASGEVPSRRIIGPLPLSTTNSIHISCFGVIPKCRQPGKWRLIRSFVSSRLEHERRH